MDFSLFRVNIYVFDRDFMGGFRVFQLGIVLYIFPPGSVPQYGID